MRAKLDENLPVEAAELLRAAGWQCDTAYDEGLTGADDARVAAVCQAEARVLFTLDLDFADIRAYPPSERHRRPATSRAESATSIGVGDARPFGLVGGMDRASTLDRGASARSRSGSE